MSTPIISTQGINRIYSTDSIDTHALSDVNISVASGEHVSIQGPSGCGKSTLLGILGLLDKPTSGEYFLCGTPTSTISHREQARLRRETIGFVFQDFLLIPEMTVYENVSLPLLYRRDMESRRRSLAVNEALSLVQMQDRAGHRPHQLSGGQQQRAAIARALVGRPSLLLADEPSGNLDSQSAKVIMDLLKEIPRSGGTLVMVTHDEGFAEQADRRLRMKDGMLFE